MRTALLLATLLLATALSGCADGDDPDPQTYQPTGDDGSTSALDADNATADDDGDDNATATTDNTAPTATLTTASDATSTNGTAPLNVTWMLGGDDADGDNLTWSLDAGNGEMFDGTELPATVNVTYEAGNWSAVLTVSDGVNATTASHNVTVSEATGGDEEPVAGGAPFFDDHLFWDVGLTDAAGSADVFMCGAGPYNTFDHYFLALDGNAGGRTFEATMTDAAGGADILFWGFYALGEGCSGDTFFDFEGGSGSGTLPEDTQYIFAYAYGGALLDMGLTIQ